MASGGVASIGVAAVAALSASHAIGAILTLQITCMASPTWGTGTMSIQGVTRTSVSTSAAEFTAQAPGTAGAADGAVHPIPACVARAGAIHRRTLAPVLAVAGGGAVGAVGSRRAGNRTAGTLETWGTNALPRHAVAVGSVLTVAQLLARLSEEAGGARLVAVQA